MNFQLNTEQLMAYYIINTLVSAFVQSLIPPDTESSKSYIVLYKFMSLIIADFKSFGANIPPPQLTATQSETVSKTVATGSINTQVQPRNTNSGIL